MNTIKECFEKILHGNRDQSRPAARRVRKLLYGSKRIDKYNDIKNLIKTAPVAYMKISEDWRQENFVTAISVIYFLHGKDDEPNFLFSWLFQLLLHSKNINTFPLFRLVLISRSKWLWLKWKSSAERNTWINSLNNTVRRVI